MSLQFSHIPYERLVDWVDGRLSEAQRPAVAAHLDQCARCREEAARIERMVTAMRLDQSADAPPAVIARAVARFRPRAVEAPPSPIQRLVAALTFASRPLTPAFGLRGEGSGERQLLFTAGDYDVDLRLAPDAGAWSLSGQLLGPETGAGTALLTGGETRRTHTFAPDAAFSFLQLPEGQYVLTLRFGDVEIVLPELAIGAA